MKEDKLTIELVPKSLWNKSIRSRILRKDWDKLRKRILEEFDNICGVCDSVIKPLHCHEEWKYDDENYIQKLNRLVSLCSLCHHVKHLGHTRSLSGKGLLDIDTVIEHFVKVNSCSEDHFYDAEDEAFDIWFDRSQHEWKVDFGEYDGFIAIVSGTVVGEKKKE